MTMTLGAALRRLRKDDLGLTLGEVCRRSRVSVGYLSQIEKNDAMPRRDKFEAIASALESDEAFLLLAERDKTDLIRQGFDPQVAEITAVLGILPLETRAEFRKILAEKAPELCEALQVLESRSEADETDSPGRETSVEHLGPGKR
jgi:transcriptional regulator with XRE-family HTH domain